METVDSNLFEVPIDQNFDVQSDMETSSDWAPILPRRYETEIIREDPELLDSQVTYWDQVYYMMHLFGDVEHPLNATVTLVNNILESQMDILIEKCENAMKLRGANDISYKDVLFVMRRNKMLLKCLLQFLDFARVSKDQIDECLAFLGTIEKFPGDLTSLYDIKITNHAPKKLIKRRSSTELIEDLETKSFLDDSGTKSFQDDFISKLRGMRPPHLNNPDEFIKWLSKCRLKYPPGEYPFDISLLAASIIDFLAIQTVSGLVEKVLHMRSRAREIKMPFYAFAPGFEHQINIFENIEDDESDNEDLSSLSTFPKVATCSKVFGRGYSSRDFIQHMGKPPVIIPMRQGAEILEEKAITPGEIHTAFLHYQRPKPMSLLMKTELSYPEKREVYLICLSFSTDEYGEI